MSQKQKKEKIKYYDDNSTIVDMSGLSKGGKPQKAKQSSFIEGGRKSTFREKWRTYWMSVKMMFVPMLIALLILTIMFLGLMALVN